MARSSALPQPEPMLATAGPLPAGSGWAYEIKWDGVRAVAAGDPGADGDRRWRVASRSGADVTARYPELAPLADQLPAGGATVLDGEIVAFDSGGTPRFELIQRRMGLTSPRAAAQRAAETPVTYVIFDVLTLAGAPTTELPYSERRELLIGLGLDGASWQTPGHRVGGGTELLEAVAGRGLEGVVAKRLDSAYLPGKRSAAWVKHRLWQSEDFVIGGWIPGAGSRSGRVGSVLVGQWSGPGRRELEFAGAVGSGLNSELIARLSEELAALERPGSPFHRGAPSGPKARTARWCEPQLVCRVAFSERTAARTLRQPAFKGMRDDIDPASVVAER